MAPSLKRTEMDACPDLESIAAYLDQRLPERERAQVTKHLADCEDCYFVFTEAVQMRAADTAATRAASEAGAAPFRKKPWWTPVMVWSAAGLATAAAMMVAIVAGVVSWRGSTTAELNELVAAVGTDRTVEGRLAGGFAHGPLRTVTRSGQPSVGVSPDVVIAAAKIEREELGQRNPNALRTLGLAYLTTGDAGRAVPVLEQAADLGSADPRALSDLAAGYIARASSAGQPEDLTKALTVATRATELDSSIAEAWFNRALALERLDLVSEARSAWRDYLKVDPQSGWADEARERLLRLDKASR